MNQKHWVLLQKTCIAVTGVTPAVYAQSAAFHTSNTFPKSAFELSRRGREKFALGDYKGAISDFN